MAREAEATREKRARIIKAEAELEASEKLAQGAQRISESPMALELRRMQMISEVAAEQNSPFPAATATAAACNTSSSRSVSVESAWGVEAISGAG